MLDTNKCLINEKYHYEPKNEKETRNFPYIEVGSAVRVSLYRKKNSDAQWKVASCLLSNSGPHHQAIKYNNRQYFWKIFILLINIYLVLEMNRFKVILT